MLRNNRVIWNDNGVLLDLSVAMGDPHAGTQPFALVASQDKLYLGSEAPFNHRFIDVGTANDLASVASVEVWFAKAWRAAVDVLDETSVGGKTLAQSGILSWVTDIDRGWDREQRSADVTGLPGTAFYNLYWARISFSANLGAGTVLSYIGHKFSQDTDLVAQYPDLGDANFKAAFQTGKTNWKTEQILAAEAIIEDLLNRRQVWTKNQILEWSRFKNASVFKTAEIIFRGMGNDYTELLKDAREAFRTTMNATNAGLDRNSNARLDPDETVSTMGYTTR